MESLPDSTQIKHLPMLPHMPWNVKKTLVRVASADVKLRLRFCSKEYKELVDKAYILYKGLKFYIEKNSVRLELRIVDDVCVKTEFYQTVGKLATKEKVLAAAVDHLIQLISNPLFGVMMLEVNLDDQSCFTHRQIKMTRSYCSRWLKHNGKKIDVHQIKGPFMCADVFIPFLAPEKLKEIEVDDVKTIDFTEWTKLEQLKKLEKLTVLPSSPEDINNQCSDYYLLKHIQELNLEFEWLTTDMVDTACKSFLENPSLQRHKLYYSEEDQQSIDEYMERFELTEETEFTKLYRCFDTNIVVEIERDVSFLFQFKIYRD